MSIRGEQWAFFAEQVQEHIDGYTVPQYGDAGDDLCTDYTPEQCIQQIQKDAKRHTTNSREGQQALDLLKIAHYAQMAHHKLHGYPDTGLPQYICDAKQSGACDGFSCPHAHPHTKAKACRRDDCVDIGLDTKVHCIPYQPTEEP